MRDLSPLPSPFTVAIDSREQLPYAFAGLTTDAREGSRPLAVATARTCLTSGDYSILGLHTRIAVERKSAADLFGTLGRGRRRFVAELARLAHYDYAAVVVEAEWSEIIAAPPPRAKLTPKTVFRSVLAWSIEYSAVRWWMCAGRAMGEAVTYRILERFWRVSQRERKQLGPSGILHRSPCHR